MTERPLLLDLFCCEGGAATGYVHAGFDVIGVDRAAQPLYPFEFHQGDWLEQAERLMETMAFAAIHASPPCQSYTTMSNRFGSEEEELLGPVRDWLRAIGLPYVIENVTGARKAMESPILIHGGQLGMTVYRPRLFESNIVLTPPPKAPSPPNPVAVYGQKDDRRRLWTRKDGTELRAASLAEARVAMEMPWASWNGVREAIPPKYAEFIGKQLRDQLGEEWAA